MGKNLNKLTLLMWKNFLLQWRHPLQTILEILVPVMCSCLLVLFRSLVVPEKSGPIDFGPFKNKWTRDEVEITIPWSPNNNGLQMIMEDTVQFFKKTNRPFREIRHLPLKNSGELDNYLKREMGVSNTWAGIDFGDSLLNQKALPEKMKIIIRYASELHTLQSPFFTWETQRLFPSLREPGPRDPSEGTGAAPSYEQEGFLLLQKQLSYSIINYFKKNIRGEEFDRRSDPIYMQRFSYCMWTSDVLLQTLKAFVGLIFMVSFVYSCVNIVNVITVEKEKQLKEAMKIMGMPGWLHWTAWFIKTFMYFVITAILIVLLLKVRWYSDTNHTVFTYSNPFVIFLFLMLFLSATTTYCFAISVFFSKANVATTVAGVAWFVSYFPYFFFRETYYNLSLTQKIVSSFFSTTAMAYGIQLILMYETSEEGVQWTNMWEPVTTDDTLLFGHILIMLAIDTILYLLIAIYVEAVFPGEYGVPQVWYFPFKHTYWFGERPIYFLHSARSMMLDTRATEDFRIENKFYEKEPISLKKGIKINHIRKVFPNQKVAVKDMSLNIYEDQITILLGHNGAGKTTTMSILTGMMPPTSGTATVNDCNIHTNMEGVRASLGLCPQHNILFDDLTVKEHLYFYSRLKGMTKKLAIAEAHKYIEMLDLQPKANSKSSTLSGGMKRKLSVGIALCADSSVVMCDEPTSGMDPTARRALWDLLQSQKKGRTILLTTHFMDEADLLGDRIAIMAQGEVQCYGSSYFLKKNYGSGYRLIMVKSDTCKPKEVTSLLRGYIPNIEVESNIGSELTYLLKKDDSPVFKDMLKSLERSSKYLGISSYGISLTTLEEVFMKVGASSSVPSEFGESSEHQGIDSSRHYKEKHTSTNTDYTFEISYTLLEGWKLWRNQIIAMLMKRGLCIIRSWPLLLIQNIIPVVFLALVIMSIRNFLDRRELPNLKITLNSYQKPVTVITRKDNKYADAYINIIENSKHVIIDWEDGDMNQLMKELTERKTNVVRTRYIIGAAFGHKNITAYFNNNPLHSAPLALQTALNAIFQTEVSSDYSLQFYNYPLPYTSFTLLEQADDKQTNGFYIGFILGFAMALSSAFYLLFYIRERACKSRLLQFVSGIGVFPFRGTAFIMDFIAYMLTILIIVITFMVFQEEGFKTASDLHNVVIILLYFGCATIPMMYLAALLFEVPTSGFTRMVLFNVIVGTGGYITVQILELPQFKAQSFAKILHSILLLVPVYSLSTGIRDTSVLQMIHRLCGKARKVCYDSIIGSKLFCRFYMCYHNPKCCPATVNYYGIKRPGIGRNIIISCIVGLICFAILLAIENKLINKIKTKFWYKPPLPKEQPEDDDVALEKNLIRNLPPDQIKNYKLIMKDVTKYYKRFLAVNRLCLGVKKQECFGLLGMNGAGKTTTFKMLTGDVRLTYGQAWVDGLSLKSDMKKVHQIISYCPQFDALLDDLTTRETLIMYGLIRGITIGECKIEAVRLSLLFDVYPHLDKQIKTLSGGNKRKVSTAIALIGNPQVVYFDEPTSGMDPATRRYLWNALCKVRDSGKCIILTSHSMEECEALCTRLAIMVNGRLLCLGSAQHLKTKYSGGLTLTIKVRKTAKVVHGGTIHEVDNIESFVKTNFVTAIVTEKHQDIIIFYIERNSQPWSEIFGILEDAKHSLNIEDYSLGQCSLEQIFLDFTRHES